MFLSYVLSFVYLGIYWNNHHHLIKRTEEVTGGILWANLHLLFWLSLFPFATAWLGENDFATTPSAFYGVVMLFAAIAYYILQTTIVAHQGRDSALAQALGSDWKGKLSPLLYLAAIGLAFVSQWIALAIYVLVALMWLIPDRRLERLQKVLLTIEFRYIKIRAWPDRPSRSPPPRSTSSSRCSTARCTATR